MRWCASPTVPTASPSCARRSASEDLAHWEKAFAGFDGVWDVMRTARRGPRRPAGDRQRLPAAHHRRQRQRVRAGGQPGAVRRDAAGADARARATASTPTRCWPNWATARTRSSSSRSNRLCCSGIGGSGPAVPARQPQLRIAGRDRALYAGQAGPLGANAHRSGGARRTAPSSALTAKHTVPDIVSL